MRIALYQPGGRSLRHAIRSAYAMVGEFGASPIRSPSGPQHGAALCSAGSLGSVPPPHRSYCGTPTPRASSGLASLPSFGRTSGLLHVRSLRGALRAGLGLLLGRCPLPALPEEDARSPRFLGDPRVHAPLSDPGGTTASGQFGPCPTFGRCGVAFRCTDGVGSHIRDFGAPSRGLHARCLRFATTVARVLPTATQDSLPAGGPPWPDRT
jgi:hypothetical protein